MKKKTDHLKLVKEKPQPKKRGKKVFRYMLYLLLFIALIFLIREGETYFRIKDIIVTGNNDISSGEIIQAGGLRRDSSIIMLRESTIAEKIISEYPQIKEVTIDRNLPDGIVVTVRERTPAGYIMTADGLWMIDREAFCFSSSGETIEDLPLIVGIEGGKVVPGFPIDCPARREMLKNFFAAGVKGDWLEIEELDLTDSYNLVVKTLDGMEIWLGGSKMLEEKLVLVRESLLHLPDDAERRLDVRSGNRLVVSKKELIEEKEVDP